MKIVIRLVVGSWALLAAFSANAACLGEKDPTALPHLISDAANAGQFDKLLCYYATNAYMPYQIGGKDQPTIIGNQAIAQAYENWNKVLNMEFIADKGPYLVDGMTYIDGKFTSTLKDGAPSKEGRYRMTLIKQFGLYRVLVDDWWTGDNRVPLSEQK